MANRAIPITALGLLLLSPGTLWGQEGRAERNAPLDWQIGFDIALANPTSDLGRLTDSGVMFIGSASKTLLHPLSVRASIKHIRLGEGGIPPNWRPEPRGPAMKLWVVTAGPVFDVTPQELDVIDFSVGGGVGMTFWESESSDLTAPFDDRDFTLSLVLETIMNLSRRWALAVRMDGLLFWGDMLGTDENPFSTEFVQGYGLGLRLRL